jgi:hypothetical protein
MSGAPATAAPVRMYSAFATCISSISYEIFSMDTKTASIERRSGSVCAIVILQDKC